jgi:hypothetical protein
MIEDDVDGHEEAHEINPTHFCWGTFEHLLTRCRQDPEIGTWKFQPCDTAGAAQRYPPQAGFAEHIIFRPASGEVNKYDEKACK